MEQDRRRGRRKKHTADEVIAAITGSAGIRTTIARRLAVHRHTIEVYLRAFPSAALAYKNEVNAIGDMVEQVILTAIKDKDIETAKWYAKNKLKHRGYSERIEIQEIRDLSDAQLIQLIQERTGTDVSGDQGSGTAEDSPTLH